jgi:hypothetical protein
MRLHDLFENNLSTQKGRLEHYLKKPIEDGMILHLSGLGKFFKGVDPLAEIVPERNGRYALHPDKWESTFYSLTNKDFKKIGYYKPTLEKAPANAIVADMAIANQFYRTDDINEQLLIAEEYKNTIVPYGSDISHMKMPEVIITSVTEDEGDDYITLQKGDKLVRVHPSRVSHFLDRHYKIVNEKINEKEAGEPIVYVDMDGVLANFFEEWAKLAGIKSGNYKDIPPADIDPTLDKMIGTDFFAQLPKFPTADKLIQMVINFFGSYKILSSPLRNDHANSKMHKIDWIGRKLKIKPSDIIIVGDKTSYAKQADGTPNILIDDLGKNIQRWQSSGGLGIKYQADEDSLSKVQQGLEQFKAGQVTQESNTSKREENIFEKDSEIK